jgi:prevent-host-death family protein
MKSIKKKVSSKKAGKAAVRAHPAMRTKIDMRVGAVLPTREVAIAALKARLSQLVREVQDGAAITVTQNGRPAALLMPLPSVTVPLMKVRAPLDRRPFGEILRSLQPLPDDARPTSEDIQDAIDQTRADRF